MEEDGGRLDIKLVYANPLTKVTNPLFLLQL